MKIIGWSVLVSGMFAFVAPAAAQAPVAIVEDVAGNADGAAFMDYVEPGKVIHLNPQSSIVLSYLKSCVREAIAGGTVRVGVERSEVEGGKVERTTVNCEAGRMMRATQETNQPAGLIVRDLPAPKPQFILYGSSPIVRLDGGGTIIIERVDVAGERHVLTIDRKQRGNFLDFADGSKPLVPGGLYRAIVGTQQIIFGVYRGAQPGRTPLPGRLILFGPAT
jgi:hypothetical protein